MPTDYNTLRKVFAMRKRHEEQIKRLCPEARHESGIYFFYRTDEKGFRYGYIGLASKSILTRLIQHLEGYKQHLDLSIKKHGLYDEQKNPYGYKISVICYCPPNEIDDKEEYYIKYYADQGFQMRNTQSGSRNGGRINIADNKPSRGYRDGIKQGRTNIKRELNKIINKYLVISTKQDNKLSQRMLDKFWEILSDDTDGE